MFMVEDTAAVSPDSTGSVVSETPHVSSTPHTSSSSVLRQSKKRRRQSRHLTDVIIDNPSVISVKGLFLGNIEERRRFGVQDIINTLGITVSWLLIKGPG